VQYRPDAAELLDAVASLLEDDVIAAVPAHLQHQVRVAANLCRILEREATVGPANDAAERARLAAVLGAGDDSDLVSLRADLAGMLADPAPIDPALDRSIRDALLATLRADLAIAKPGYDATTGAP
jgi:AcrR family transcriptional regulator